MCLSTWTPHQYPLTWQLSATHTQCHQQHSQEREQQEAQHKEDRADCLHLQGRAWTGPSCSPHTPWGHSSSGARARPRRVQGLSGHEAGSLVGGSCALLGGSLGLLPSVGVSAGSGRPLNPGRSGPDLESGASHPYTDPVPQPYLPLDSAPASPQCLPACGRKLW